MPGSGYFWGPSSPDEVRHVIQLASRMARCWFYIAALHKREGTAMAAVQMVFNFMEAHRPDDPRQADDLAALVASEGTSVADFLHAFVARLATTDHGRRVLADVGRRHADVLVPADLLATVKHQVNAALDRLTSESRPANPAPHAGQ